MKDRTKEQLIKELEASETQRRFLEAELSLLQKLVPTINDADDFHLALFAVIKRICQTTDWVYGEAWVPSHDGKVLERSPAWYSSVKELDRFSKLSERFTFAAGEGLPGRIWLEKKPLWIKDLTDEKCFIRTRIAAEAGLKSCLALPVLLRNEVQAVLIFCLPLVSPEDDGLVEIVSTVAAQLGSLIQRKKAESALAASEAYFRSLFESSQDSICHISPDGKFININPAGCAINEFDRPDELIGKGASDSIVENREAAEEAIRRAARGETVSLQYKSLSSRGKEIWWDSKVVPIRGANGAITGVLRISRDITEKRRMEGELIRAQKIESVGTLAGGIAHDFNNILSIIMGKISLAKMFTRPESEISATLISAEKACKRAADLTRQLLTFAIGGAPIKKTAYLADLIKESADFVLRGAAVGCELSIPDDLWPVDIDEGQISQVINNLIINADQAMPEGGTIKASAENIVLGAISDIPLPQGRYVKISIRDEGTGIPEEHLPNIFDPYFTTKQKGSGLGLATSFSIVKRHDGHIMAESRMGAGTAFHIFLPASMHEKIAVESRATGKGKVLIVEDEEFLRDSTATLLEHMGYQVESAEEGGEGIELYVRAMESGEPFDAVVMDLTIPGGMGGKEAIQRLLKIDPAVKTIVSSGYSSDDVMSEFKKYGFIGVVSKPYEIKELSRMLNEIIGEK